MTILLVFLVPVVIIVLYEMIRGLGDYGDGTNFYDD